MSLKLKVSLASSFAFLFLSLTPTKSLAVVQSLNGSNTSNQSFQNDSNVTISTNTGAGVHSLGWSGQLPISRGGTGMGSFTSGSLFFFNGTSFAQDNSNLFWDNTNKRLGIGNSSPSTTLDVSGNTRVTSLTSTSDSVINSLNIGLGGGAMSSNLRFGASTLSSNTTGVRNVAIGNAALSATNTNDNTAIGANALGGGSNTGEQNTAVGSQVLQANTTGVENVAVGHKALQFNTTGIRSVGVGVSALKSNTTASENVAIGNNSLSDNTTGDLNVAVGGFSATHLAGTRNVVLGDYAAHYQADGSTYLTSANYGVYLGQNTKGLDNNDSNSIVVGYNATGAGSNKAVMGNSAVTDVYFGSSSANANIHGLTLYSGSATVPGCIVMGDTAGGVGYVTLNNGVLTVSSTKPAACQ